MSTVLLVTPARVADVIISENTFKNISTYAISIGYLDGGVIEKNKMFNELPIDICI